ncbi:RNA cytidine acetyltransferase 1-like [Humulus lupulus]|uniref:RNA cytidine acetyltransferase 1-like n=1 Tax=Humulus lupulus TaxID=3486 RepID=UPI002B412415|nr:RNA cytidine acetyltransferase 1-like [Humulus lupulus]
MKLKVDDRIRTLIENGVKTRHRNMFIVVGDKYLDTVKNLHYILTKAAVKSRPSVLWCYKNKLEISSHKKKRAKQLKRLMQSGLQDAEKADSLSLFLETAGLTYCLYKDSEKVLGNTFGMCVLQDFEALTPNLLARSIETVEGGGLVILLLHSLSSLTSLYTMVMDVHERYRTESHSEATGRFNERFLLSVASCRACVVMDDEFNILPISSHIKSITPVPAKEDSEGLSEAEKDLKDLKEQLIDDFPVGPLIKKCCTLDQGKAVITFLDAILDKTLRSTIALLAARGRGKSAALGLAIAGAIAAGYSNIFVTAPSPENLRTLFDFVCKGFEALDFKEHMDFDVVKSTNIEFKKATVRINIYKQHRQTIQYIQPHEHEKLSQVELLVIDEAAAIPLPVVKSLLGPYLVFLSSTVNGYEGTGRSLSLKLIQQLEQQSQTSAQAVEGALSGRLFKKIELSESIRYASGDPIESWLHGLLCLDATNSVPKLSGLPHPSKCELYYVNRDTLFSFHKESELFLQRMMALYVSSHYKNSPNDLQLMADAPAHHLFVLLGPVESKNQLPDILCVIQVCLEGQISRASALRSLSTGRQPAGDQIPWKFNEQFQDTVFPTLSGARIVRIATHPSAIKLGYGSQAVELLTRYYEGQFAPISEMDSENAVEKTPVRVIEAAKQVSLLEENIQPKKKLPHLLVHLRERKPEKLHYIGVSFGLTLELFRFWRKHKFVPFFIGHSPSTVTGEHSCMVLKPLNNDDIEAKGSDEYGFLGPFYQDFRLRFSNLLSHTFRSMEYKLAMSILEPKIKFMEPDSGTSTLDGFVTSIERVLSPYDLKRLDAYTSNLADYHMILDLVPKLTRLYFHEKLPVSLSAAQASILLCIGLQNQDVSYIEREMGLERQQILSQFIKAMKKFHKYLDRIASKEIESSMPRLSEIAIEPNKVSMERDLEKAARQAEEDMKTDLKGVMDPELLEQYTNGGTKSSKNKTESNSGKKRGKSYQGSKSNKKKKFQH